MVWPACASLPRGTIFCPARVSRSKRTRVAFALRVLDHDDRIGLWWNRGAGHDLHAGPRPQRGGHRVSGFDLAGAYKIGSFGRPRRGRHNRRGLHDRMAGMRGRFLLVGRAPAQRFPDIYDRRRARAFFLGGLLDYGLAGLLVGEHCLLVLQFLRRAGILRTRPQQCCAPTNALQPAGEELCFRALWWRRAPGLLRSCRFRFAKIR